MSRPAARLGDICSGHVCWPPRNNYQGSPDKYVNNLPQHRLGDGWVVHCCPKRGCHPGVLASGSKSVLVNNRPAGRMGDAVSCGSVVATGSFNYFIGG